MTDLHAALLKIRAAQRLRRDEHYLGLPDHQRNIDRAVSGLAWTPGPQAIAEQQASNHRVRDVNVYLRLERDGYITTSGPGTPYRLTTRGHALLAEGGYL